MPSISETLGAVAGSYELELNGRTIRLGLITQKTKSELERWLYQKEVKGVLEIKEALGDDFKSFMNEVITKQTAGEFSWGGTTMVKAMGTIAGIAKTISLVSVDPNTRLAVPADEIEKALFDESVNETLLTNFTAIFSESMPAKKKRKTRKKPEGESEAVNPEPPPQ